MGAGFRDVTFPATNESAAAPLQPIGDKHGGICAKLLEVAWGIGNWGFVYTDKFDNLNILKTKAYKVDKLVFMKNSCSSYIIL